MSGPQYSRVLLKVSGEVLAGDQNFGIEPKFLAAMAAQIAEVARSGAPEDVVWIMDYLFTTVHDGRNAFLTDGIQRALGRPPRDFTVYAHEVASTGIWRVAA